MEVNVKLVPSGVDEDGEEQFMELDEAIISSLKPCLERHVQKKVDSVTATVIKEIVWEHVATLSVAAFSKAFQQTDNWGQKKGEPQSLGEIVQVQAKQYLEQKVNDHGEPSYNGRPRCQWMVNRAMNDAIQDEIGKKLATLREDFAKKIAAKIANVKVS